MAFGLGQLGDGLGDGSVNGWQVLIDRSLSFGGEMKKDLAAVRAGLMESWSTGPVEGFIHKLKLIKRQGYGRANLDLLRARALAA